MGMERTESRAFRYALAGNPARSVFEKQVVYIVQGNRLLGIRLISGVSVVHHACRFHCQRELVE